MKVKEFVLDVAPLIGTYRMGDKTVQLYKEGRYMAGTLQAAATLGSLISDFFTIASLGAGAGGKAAIVAGLKSIPKGLKSIPKGLESIPKLFMEGGIFDKATKIPTKMPNIRSGITQIKNTSLQFANYANEHLVAWREGTALRTLNHFIGPEPNKIPIKKKSRQTSQTHFLGQPPTSTLISSSKKSTIPKPTNPPTNKVNIQQVTIQGLTNEEKNKILSLFSKEEKDVISSALDELPNMGSGEKVVTKIRNILGDSKKGEDQKINDIRQALIDAYKLE